MKKMVLLGIGNFQDFNYYIFKKDKRLLENLDILFKKVFDMYTHLSCDEIDGENKKIDIFKLKDEHHSEIHTSKNIKITTFYGDKKIYLTIVCSSTMRLKFNESLGKIAKIPKPKKLKKKFLLRDKK